MENIQHSTSNIQHPINGSRGQGRALGVARRRNGSLRVAGASVRGFLLAVVMLFAVAAPAMDFLVFFGAYASASSKGIYVSRLDADTGKLSAPELAAATPSPCYLAISPNEKFLYAANSIPKFDGQAAGAVSAFAIDKISGRLDLLDEKSSGAAGPCHVSVDATGNALFVANYNSGCVKSFRMQSGRISKDGTFIQHRGSSVNTNRQTAAHAHCISADPSNRFVLACDLGTDKVEIYRLDADAATLAENGSASVPPGSGARHLGFAPDGKFAYVINEMACTVTVFAWDSENGKLDLRETVSALPPDVALQSEFTGAEILVHPSGNFV